MATGFAVNKAYGIQLLAPVIWLVLILSMEKRIVDVCNLGVALGCATGVAVVCGTKAVDVITGGRQVHAEFMRVNERTDETCE